MEKDFLLENCEYKIQYIYTFWMKSGWNKCYKVKFIYSENL